MTEDYFIIVAVGIVSIVSIFYIPPKRYRLALLSFLLCQVISWPQPLIFVQIGYVEFPVRDFVRATKVNFTILYLFIPMVFTWFMLIFPQKVSLLRKTVHYIIFVSIIVWFVYYISQYTDLQKYLKGTTLFHVMTLYLRVSVYFIICHLIIKWFSKKTNVLVGEVNV